MGRVLLKFYDLMKAEGGVQGQMRLAMKTGITSTTAQAEQDSPANIAKFKAAFKDIVGKDAPIN